MLVEVSGPCFPVCKMEIAAPTTQDSWEGWVGWAGAGAASVAIVIPGDQEGGDHWAVPLPLTFLPSLALCTFPLRPRASRSSHGLANMVTHGLWSTAPEE